MFDIEGVLRKQLRDAMASRQTLIFPKASRRIREPVYFSIMAVREGYADAVLGGVAHASRDFFVPCLRILEKEGTVYEMCLFALPADHPAGIFEQNVVMFADVALNPVPSAEALADIAVGACRTFRDLVPASALPEINGALLSYSTRGSGQGPSVERIREAEPLIQRKLADLQAKHPEYASVNIVSEMQISVALSESAAHSKLKEEFGELKGAGRAHPTTTSFPGSAFWRSTRARPRPRWLCTRARTWSSARISATPPQTLRPAIRWPSSSPCAARSWRTSSRTTI